MAPRYRGAMAGTLGDSGAFSLNGSKDLSAGEGGLLVTDDEEALRFARRLAIFGEDMPPTPPGRYRAYCSHRVGWNYRSHELTAALARSQLTRLDDFNRTAQRNARLLNGALAELPGLQPAARARRPQLRLLPLPDHASTATSSASPEPPTELRDRLLVRPSMPRVWRPPSGSCGRCRSNRSSATAASLRDPSPTRIHAGCSRARS